MSDQKKKVQDRKASALSSSGVHPPSRAKASQASGGTPSQVAAPRATGALIEHAALFRAIENFIRANSNFESSIPINAAVDELGKSADLTTTFSIPLQHKLLTMEGALQWVLFLSVAPDRAVQEGDAPFSPEAPFSSAQALALLAGVYDVGVQEAVWEHFALDDEDEDDEDDEEEVDEDGQ